MKTVTIEKLLIWAFTQELPKVGSGDVSVGLGLSSAWAMTRDFAVLGTLIDRSPNIYGVVPDFLEYAEPHPDALAVGAAVRALAEIRVEIPDGWHPFPEWPDEHGLIAAEVSRVVEEQRLKGDRVSGRYVVALVTGSAILGFGPDWRADMPRTQMVKHAGKEAWFVTRKTRDAFGRVYEYETDGFDRRKQRPVRGAYRKYVLSDPIRGAILSRLEWELWQDALAYLAKSLASRLEGHAIAPFVPDRHPWRRRARSENSSQGIDMAG
ncbi:hypothetical protein NBH20_01500 [Rhizobium sp. S153]|uniref:Uncharacterized protein n=1 Tax=Ciceribacter sichuanensis TaxID=2949647 RepID=A0ABT0V2Z7_9HYPH|nr:hypothetical protein [Ciceribacter sp. S153]MCM2399817.1 hypothetical protein [Ciceribacter sp. S153]